MSTITLSPALVSFLTDKIVGNATASTAYNDATTYKHNLFTFNRAWQQTNYPYATVSLFETSFVQFKDVSNNVLVKVALDTFTRTQDGNGYIVYSGMPATYPTANGTVAFLTFDGLLTERSGYQAPTTTTYAHSVTLTVDDVETGADIELADRNIVTGQPWRMDGSFRFRIPSSYTYTL